MPEDPAVMTYDGSFHSRNEIRRWLHGHDWTVTTEWHGGDDTRFHIDVPDHGKVLVNPGERVVRVDDQFRVIRHGRTKVA